MFVVREVCKPPEGHTDTAEQAALRSCLIGALEGRSPVDQIRIGRDLVELMRDQLMAAASAVRNAAAIEARLTMSPEEIRLGSGSSRATISRLLTKGRLS